MVRGRIRLARSGDCQTLARMRYQFRTERGTATEMESVFIRRCASWMKKHFQSEAWRCWVVEDKKQLLGHVCVQLFEKIPNPIDEPERHAYITNCYVIPQIRSRGIGRRLLNKALAWCRAQGTDAVILWPTPASKSLYRRFGFANASNIFELRQGGDRSACCQEPNL